jgi:hypothetical protein
MAMTYVDALTIAINAVDSETAEKLTALKAQLMKKKSSSKPTKAQLANEAVKEEIREVLGSADEPMTVTEILKAMPNEYSSQKISALLRQMGEEGTKEVVKTIEKKVSRFALA